MPACYKMIRLKTLKKELPQSQEFCYYTDILLFPQTKRNHNRETDQEEENLQKNMQSLMSPCRTAYKSRTRVHVTKTREPTGTRALQHRGTFTPFVTFTPCHWVSGHPLRTQESMRATGTEGLFWSIPFYPHQLRIYSV